MRHIFRWLSAPVPAAPPSVAIAEDEVTAQLPAIARLQECGR